MDDQDLYSLMFSRFPTTLAKSISFFKHPQLLVCPLIKDRPSIIRSVPQSHLQNQNVVLSTLFSNLNTKILLNLMPDISFISRAMPKYRHFFTNEVANSRFLSSSIFSCRYHSHSYHYPQCYPVYGR